MEPHHTVIHCDPCYNIYDSCTDLPQSTSTSNVPSDEKLTIKLLYEWLKHKLKHLVIVRRDSDCTGDSRSRCWDAPFRFKSVKSTPAKQAFHQKLSSQGCISQCCCIWQDCLSNAYSLYVTVSSLQHLASTATYDAQQAVCILVGPSQEKNAYTHR